MKEHKHELIKKIQEEAKEITHASSKELASEIADVQQALDDLIRLHGLTKQDIITAQKIKNDKNGSFQKGLFIDYVEVSDDDEWAAYFRKNSDRYPEIT